MHANHQERDTVILVHLENGSGLLTRIKYRFQYKFRLTSLGAFKFSGLDWDNLKTKAKKLYLVSKTNFSVIFFLVLIPENEGSAIHRLETEKTSWIFQCESIPLAK